MRRGPYEGGGGYGEGGVRRGASELVRDRVSGRMHVLLRLLGGCKFVAVGADVTFSGCVLRANA